MSEKSLLDAAEDDEFEDKDVCPICGDPDSYED